VFVGWPTQQAIWGQRFIPGLLDRYLAKMAWDGQMYDGPREPDAPVDLWEPVPGYEAAHGAFDARARDQSAELWAATHRAWIGAAAATAAGLTVAALKARR
jgi:hypothetical protein